MSPEFALAQHTNGVPKAINSHQVKLKIEEILACLKLANEIDLLTPYSC